MRSLLFISALLVSSAFGTEEKKAVTKLTGQNNGANVTGNITFTQSGEILLISGTIEGLTPNQKHGFHIHEKGDLSSGCISTGGHFNPYNKSHGGPTDAERHVGDLGNIDANDNGVATFTMSDKIASLNGANSILGRGVVVHSDVDDYGKGGHPDSLTTGHAGSRIACGVIGTLNLGDANSANVLTSIFYILPFSILVALVN